MPSLTPILFPTLAGKIYRCPMPFGPYDSDQTVFAALKAARLTAVVLLVADVEARAKSGRDLRALYAGEGWQVIHLPVADFATPQPGEFQQAIEHTVALAAAGGNIAVHCNAGIGRTGLFLSALAARVLHLPAAQAIDWVRQYIPAAVETEQQRLFLSEYLSPAFGRDRSQ